jgi:hypothetical protein
MIAPGIETGSDIYTLRRQICERANEAMRISYQTVFFRSGETPARRTTVTLTWIDGAPKIQDTPRCAAGCHWFHLR